MAKRGGVPLISGIKPARLLVAAVIVMLALWIGAVSLAFSIRKRSPTVSYSLAPYHAAVATERAKAALESGRSDQAVQFAERAVRRDPTAVTALATIGLVRHAAGDSAASESMLAFANRLSRRDLTTHLWGIEAAVARDDIPGALRHHDLALRTSVGAREILFPILGQTLDDPAIAPGLIKRLAEFPLWWDPFLHFVATEPAVPVTVASQFLVAVQRGGVAPPATALATLIGRGLAAQRYADAWTAYVLARPRADRRRVRSPDFTDMPETPTMFDWSLTADSGILAEAIPTSRQAAELRVSAGAGVVGVASQQLQLLPSGRYRLAVRTIDAALPDGELTWTIACENGLELARLKVPNTRVPTTVSASFAVPSTCAAQWLKLLASASESNGGIEGRFAQVDILPGGAPAR